MLGRKTYTRDELDHCRAAVEHQLTAYGRLVTSRGDGDGFDAARAAFEGHFFNALTLVIDRFFVHRLRSVAGKDGNALDEVEMLADSLINNQGELRHSTVIEYVAEQSVVGLQIGDRITLNEDVFRRLSTAFFAEIDSRFL
jgi:hypothetical protein